jgi:hypothetical protein
MYGGSGVVGQTFLSGVPGVVGFGGPQAANEQDVGANGGPAGVKGLGGSGDAPGVVGRGGGTGPGVLGQSNGSGPGVLGYGFLSGLAGQFVGNVTINGNLDVSGAITKGSGTFKIDHPLDPENKYLSHSFVESPDMMNIYNGNIVLDENGEAIVVLPEWFEALNKDFRYQLTTIGGYAPVFIGTKISGNTFKIAGGKAGLEVSWEVTGIRKDPYSDMHRAPVEELKPEGQRGTYLHPDAYGQTPATNGWEHP